jgi:hypothetical protein
MTDVVKGDGQKSPLQYVREEKKCDASIAAARSRR